MGKLTNKIRLEVDTNKVANSVLDPNGEAELIGWSKSQAGMTLAPVLTTEGAQAGNYVAHIKSVAGQFSNAYANVYPAQQSDWFSASVLAWANTAGTYLDLYVQYLDQNMTVIGSAMGTANALLPTGVATAWTTVTVPPREAPANTAFARLSIRVTDTSTAGVAGATVKEVFVRNVALVGGNYRLSGHPDYSSIGTPAWRPIECSTTHINVEHGNEQEGAIDRLAVGILNARIIDSSLDPAVDNTLSPGAKVRASAFDGTTWQSLFVGKVSTLNTDYDDGRVNISLVATDAVTQLDNIVRPRHMSGTFKQRLTRLLAATGVEHSITDTAANASTTSLLSIMDNGKLRDQLELARNTLGGQLFVDRNGVVRGIASNSINSSIKQENILVSDIHWNHIDNVNTHLSANGVNLLANPTAEPNIAQHAQTNIKPRVKHYWSSNRIPDNHLQLELLAESASYVNNDTVNGWDKTPRIQIAPSNTVNATSGQGVYVPNGTTCTLQLELKALRPCRVEVWTERIALSGASNTAPQKLQTYDLALGEEKTIVVPYTGGVTGPATTHPMDRIRFSLAFRANGGGSILAAFPNDPTVVTGTYNGNNWSTNSKGRFLQIGDPVLMKGEWTEPIAYFDEKYPFVTGDPDTVSAIGPYGIDNPGTHTNPQAKHECLLADGIDTDFDFTTAVNSVLINAHTLDTEGKPVEVEYGPYQNPDSLRRWQTNQQVIDINSGIPATVAGNVLKNYANPRVKAKSVSWDGSRNITRSATLEVYDPITVWYAEGTLYDFYRVIRVRHEITPDSWKVTATLRPFEVSTQAVVATPPPASSPNGPGTNPIAVVPGGGGGGEIVSHVKCVLTADQSVPSHTYYKVAWPTPVLNTLPNDVVLQNGTDFILNKTGLWLATFQLRFYAAGGIERNGWVAPSNLPETRMVWDGDPNVSGNYPFVTASGVFEVETAGTAYSVFAHQDSGADNSLFEFGQANNVTFTYLGTSAGASTPGNGATTTARARYACTGQNIASGTDTKVQYSFASRTSEYVVPANNNSDFTLNLTGDWLIQVTTRFNGGTNASGQFYRQALGKFSSDSAGNYGRSQQWVYNDANTFGCSVTNTISEYVTAGTVFSLYAGHNAGSSLALEPGEQGTYITFRYLG